MVREFLEEKYRQYASPTFLETDPVQVPHQYEAPNDIEIAALLTATLSWGQRTQIIRFARNLMNALGKSPFDFICSYSQRSEKHTVRFQYRTFTPTDCNVFFHALRQLYLRDNGLRLSFTEGYQSNQTIKSAIANFRRKMLETNLPKRTHKHLSDPINGSAAKRLNMFLRWMVRPATEGVDFGLWTEIPTSHLMLPVDLHSGRAARNLGLLKRNSNDWKAVEEVTAQLAKFDPHDPVKYDYALFGLGIFEKY